tara:strand:+ start:47 stop:259 length:213 start_codon:yes stop_codon:yes gene_type:complete
MKVEGHPNLRRDMSTGAIVNTNGNAYQNYIMKKNRNEKEVEDLNRMREDIDSLKDDISTIKDLLLKLAEK